MYTYNRASESLLSNDYNILDKLSKDYNISDNLSKNYNISDTLSNIYDKSFDQIKAHTFFLETLKIQN